MRFPPPSAYACACPTPQPSHRRAIVHSLLLRTVAARPCVGTLSCVLWGGVCATHDRCKTWQPNKASDTLPFFTGGSSSSMATCLCPRLSSSHLFVAPALLAPLPWGYDKHCHFLELETFKSSLVCPSYTLFDLDRYIVHVTTWRSFYYTHVTFECLATIQKIGAVTHPLGLWVRHQRSMYTSGNMSPVEILKSQPPLKLTLDLTIVLTLRNF